MQQRTTRGGHLGYVELPGPAWRPSLETWSQLNTLLQVSPLQQRMATEDAKPVTVHAWRQVLHKSPL